MSGEGIAAILASLATLVGVCGNVVLQLKQAKLSASNAEKLDAVHAATTAIVEATGTHQTLKLDP